MIINRADEDFSSQQYGQEIEKMTSLKNEKGPLFSEEEQDFLKYIIEN